jgi:hypothetical protein
MCTIFHTHTHTHISLSSSTMTLGCFDLIFLNEIRPELLARKKRNIGQLVSFLYMSYIRSSPYFFLLFFIYIPLEVIPLLFSFFLVRSVSLERPKQLDGRGGQKKKRERETHLYSQYHSELFFLSFYSSCVCSFFFFTLRVFCFVFPLSIGRPSRWTVGIWPWPKAFKKEHHPKPYRKEATRVKTKK